MNKELKNLTEKQDKEFDNKFLTKHSNSDIAFEFVNSVNIIQDTGELKTFIAKIRKEIAEKVRKETAEAVCDKMIGSNKHKARVSRYNDVFYEGYDFRIKEEKEIKKQILKELNI